MRLEFSRTAVTASLMASLTSRLFYGLALDAPEAANAAWLAAPVGLVLALPVVWLACGMKPPARRALAVPLFAAMAWDAAASIEWTAFSESCLAFDHISPVLMMLPLLLAVIRCAWLGADALGGAARFWVRLFALLILVVLLHQLPFYDPGWLKPWLGFSANGILHAGIRAAGWCALIAMSAITVCTEALSFRDVLPGMLIAAAVAAVLAALRQMMAPTALGGVTRAAAIDALLTNGRAPLYLQLPMIVTWFAGMLHLIAYEAIAACALLKRALSRMREAACIILGLIAVFALALTRAPRASWGQDAFMYLYHALLSAAFILRLTEGRKPNCAPSA